MWSNNSPEGHREERQQGIRVIAPPMTHASHTFHLLLLGSLLTGAAGLVCAGAPQPLAAEGTMATGPIANIDAHSITSGGIYSGLVLHDPATQHLVIVDPDLAADDAGVLTGFVDATDTAPDGSSRHRVIPVHGRLRLNDTQVVKLGGAATGTTSVAWTHAVAFEGLAELDQQEDWTLTVHGRSRGRATGAALARPTWQWQLTLTSSAGWKATGAATLTLDAGTAAGFYATPEEWTPRTPDLTQWQGDAVLAVDGQSREDGRSRLTLGYAEEESGVFLLRCANGVARVRQSGAMTTSAPEAQAAWAQEGKGPEAFGLLPAHVLFTTPGSSSRVVFEWAEEYWK